MSLIERVKKRIPDVDENILQELSTTVSDRLCIRLGTNTLPEIFESICVDATVKMYRRIYYEGISSEGAANITTSFVENILAEYTGEVEAYKETVRNNSGSGRKVSFL